MFVSIYLKLLAIYNANIEIRIGYLVKKRGGIVIVLIHKHIYSCLLVGLKIKIPSNLKLKRFVELPEEESLLKEISPLLRKNCQNLHINH